jgi:unspecific monooxygenase
MKLMLAAIYTQYSTTIVDDEGIEAIDAYIVKPKSDKLMIKFTKT